MFQTEVFGKTLVSVRMRDPSERTRQLGFLPPCTERKGPLDETSRIRRLKRPTALSGGNFTVCKRNPKDDASAFQFFLFELLSLPDGTERWSTEVLSRCSPSGSSTQPAVADQRSQHADTGIVWVAIEP
jgi:hypothetical protein